MLCGGVACGVDTIICCVVELVVEWLRSYVVWWSGFGMGEITCCVVEWVGSSVVCGVIGGVGKNTRCMAEWLVEWVRSSVLDWSLYYALLCCGVGNDVVKIIYPMVR